MKLSTDGYSLSVKVIRLDLGLVYITGGELEEYISYEWSLVSWIVREEIGRAIVIDSVPMGVSQLY